MHLANTNFLTISYTFITYKSNNSLKIIYHYVQFFLTIKEKKKNPNKVHTLLVDCYICLSLFLGFPGSSAGKEPACNAGNTSSIPGSWRSPGEGIGMGFSGGSDSKESTCNAGDLGSIPVLGRSPGGRHGNPLQYSCLENSYGQKPGGLQSMGSQKVSIGLYLFCRPSTY